MSFKNCYTYTLQQCYGGKALLQIHSAVCQTKLQFIYITKNYAKECCYFQVSQ